MNIDDITLAPWHRGEWHGELVSVDECPTDDFTKEDVERVVAWKEDPSKGGWDGSAVGIVQLKDGRFVAWESWWDCTGSGFSRDAYGGDTDIVFARTAEAAHAALTEKARELLAEV